MYNSSNYGQGTENDGYEVFRRNKDMSDFL